MGGKAHHNMAEDLNWAVGGEAGDGIDSTGKIFAQALARAGRHVFTSKDFASRIRGGYTAYKIRTSVDKVQSVVDRLDILVALTQRTIDENLDELHEAAPSSTTASGPGKPRSPTR